MFEDGARLDDIINFFKPPTLDDKNSKEEERVADSAIRYASKKDLGADNIQLDFTRQIGSEVLK